MTLPVAILLGLAALAALLGAAACLRLARPLERLHAGGFVAVACTLPVVLAACLADGVTPRALKALAILLLVLFGNAVATHAAARAILLREGRRR
ncbi:hypothetical protein GCM10011390_18590 [Aureimonas endophytica]|uniref:Monovalent cation/H(+) antiporter subunit G n=1 Tax=Aureimonas endophytica TaxID=2027858 RepID=A0A916ZIW0_9HYPH|nr:monovalent cation/H(+) antiporter subunit G [Aureimonas endophytica]GGE00075.1 hypothetical protein GCM10011390_18590 [Aureimonas endophytica]